MADHNNALQRKEPHIPSEISTTEKNSSEGNTVDFFRNTSPDTNISAIIPNKVTENPLDSEASMQEMLAKVNTEIEAMNNYSQTQSTLSTPIPIEKINEMTDSYTDIEELATKISRKPNPPKYKKNDTLSNLKELNAESQKYSMSDLEEKLKSMSKIWMKKGWEKQVEATNYTSLLNTRNKKEKGRIDRNSLIAEEIVTLYNTVQERKKNTPILDQPIDLNFLPANTPENKVPQYDRILDSMLTNTEITPNQYDINGGELSEEEKKRINSQIDENFSQSGSSLEDRVAETSFDPVYTSRPTEEAMKKAFEHYEINSDISLPANVKGIAEGHEENSFLLIVDNDNTENISVLTKEKLEALLIKSRQEEEEEEEEDLPNQQITGERFKTQYNDELHEYSSNFRNKGYRASTETEFGYHLLTKGIEEKGIIRDTINLIIGNKRKMMKYIGSEAMKEVMTTGEKTTTPVLKLMGEYVISHKVLPFTEKMTSKAYYLTKNTSYFLQAAFLGAGGFSITQKTIQENKQN